MTFSVPDLVKLSKITNLGVLEILNNIEILNHDGVSKTLTNGIGDRIVRAWHTASLNEGAFRVLRILKLWYHKELTSNTLAYVTSFPSLAVYDVRGCDFGSEAYPLAKDYGWELSSNRNILAQLEHRCEERVLEMQQVCEKDRPPARYLRGSHAQHLWDNGKRVLIPREDAQRLHGQKSIKGMKDASGPHIPKKPKTQQSEDEPGGHERTLCKSAAAGLSAPKNWDFEIYCAFVRIGELRDDSDLTRAGVHIGAHAVAVNELISSIPLVSICLGPKPSRPLLSRGFTFMRIKIPSRIFAKTDCHAGALDASCTSNTTNKRRCPSIMRAKKRKLDDVLSSFL